MTPCARLQACYFRPVTSTVFCLLLLTQAAPTPLDEPPAERPSRELVSAGAAAAGFVGGALLAMPTLFSVLPLGGPLIAAPVAIAIVGAGAGFGGFLGALMHARLLPSLGAGGITFGAVALGAGAGVGAAAFLTSSADTTTVFLAALAAGALGGLTGAALGGAWGTWLVSAPLSAADPALPAAPAASAPAPTPPAQTP